MVSKKDVRESDVAAAPAPVVLSEGAGVALGNVFNRLIKPKAWERPAKAAGKRPRGERDSIVLAESEEVQENLALEKEERQKYKEAKKAKLKFESNALVIPDAATGAALEKELLATATKGAVALFNAVSKAQKIAEEKPVGKKKKKGPPVSRESFMDMMRAGVSRGTPSKGNQEVAASASSDEDEKAATPSAKWLKDDYLTAGSKKLKDWDKETADPGSRERSSESDS